MITYNLGTKKWNYKNLRGLVKIVEEKKYPNTEL